MPDPAVVRFAPSPTGPPHLGSLRTALFDWLLARATGGRFIVRIEDTDRERFDPAAEALMLAALRWLGLDWDEGPDVGGPHGPYRQSERLDRYRRAADRLIEEGRAYRCTCSPERLEIVQKRLRAQGRMAVYDNHCRDLGVGPTTEPHVVRFKMPLQGTLTVHDLVYGDVRFEADRLAGDSVLLKSDGFPTYHLAVVVDDHAMGITHAIRGEEWLPSAPLHVLLFEALGWQPPTLIHLPLVTDRAGKKIKKRDPSFLVSAYQQQGYLPEAMANALAFLGWHPGSTDEVFTLAEMTARFSLDRLSRGAAAFDEDKLRWFARQHMARLSPDALLDRTLPLIQARYPQALSADPAWLRRLVELVREEMVTLNDVVPAVRFAFEPDPVTAEAQAALAVEQARPALLALREQVAGLDRLDAQSAAALFKELRSRFKRSHGWAAQAVMFPLRAALTGSTSGPHLSDVAAILGKDETLRRVDHALSLL